MSLVSMLSPKLNTKTIVNIKKLCYLYLRFKKKTKFDRNISYNKPLSALHLS